MLYAKLIEQECSWAHIEALQSVVLKHGTPLSYYTDCHSIFRYVKGRDQLHQKYNLLPTTLTRNGKWLSRTAISNRFTLSPQAKGKIERPYGWVQDHLVRTCIRENVKDINHAQRILNAEVSHYNFKQIHSTTMEIPIRRFNSAIEAKIFIPPLVDSEAFLSVRDIFALRTSRFVDNYHCVIINNFKFKLTDVEPRQPVDIRIYILNQDFCELRFWYQSKLIKVERIKNKDFLPVHF